MRDTLGQRVVVAVDGSAASWATASLAAEEARLRHRPLQLISAASEMSGGLGPYLTAVVGRLSARWPEVAITTRVLDGDITERLIDESRWATLVVVGRDAANGRHYQVAAHTFCPAMVVPAAVGQTAGGPVLLGVDMSPYDEQAIGFAFEQAALRGVPLVAVHVWSGIPGTALSDINPFAYNLCQARTTADRLLAETLAGWTEKYPNVPVQRMALYDVNPARTLLQAAADAGLVVVGANRFGTTSPQLLGPVARVLLDHAPCAVCVVRQTSR
ncbi:universal stress protein [Phytohabitans houttuyneae]|uniref:Universal stress protein n=1 Tax=Phytohabitans houttuyneae TaxID=1076126 RepID=A0A6V8KER1_9ACTN|nr:universal stress protein [Phytohabitans houttuyneae]GFJ80941.1 universal stress protein [Phytohabitans houttuyneae]